MGFARPLLSCLSIATVYDQQRPHPPLPHRRCSRNATAMTPPSTLHLPSLSLLSLFSSPSLSLSSTTAAAVATTVDNGRRFRGKILYLQTLNVNPHKALHINPQFRSAPLQTLKSVENCLFSMGIERSDLGRIFDMYPQLLTSDPCLDLYPVFEFLLNDVQIAYPDVRKAIIRCPRLLISSVDDQLRPALWFLRKLGFVGEHKINCQSTVLLVSNVGNTLIPKLSFLRDMGFSYREVSSMVVRSPGLLTFSIDKNYKPKIEYFLREMKGDLIDIRQFPQYFSFSLEGKIKPRHKLLVEHGLSMPLSQMLKVSDGEFTVRLIEMRLQYTKTRRLL